LFFQVLQSSQVLGGKLEVEAKPSQEKLQDKPNRSKSDDPRQKPANQKGAQNAAFKKRRNRSSKRPPRAGRGVYHGLWWRWHAVLSERTAVHPSLLLICVFPFRLHVQFFDLICFFLLIKGGCIRLEASVEFISYSLSHSQTPLKKKKVEEEGLGKRRRVGGKSKDWNSCEA